MSPLPRSALASLISLSCLTAPFQASAGLAAEASAQILSGNSWDRPNDGSDWNHYAFNQTDPVTLSSARQLELIDAQGHAATTSFSHSASATAGYGMLSASASVEVNNPLPRNGGPLYTVYENGNYQIQAGGLPDGFGARAYAAMSDTVALSNSQVTQVQFLLHLDGTLAGLTEAERSYFMPSASVQLDQRDWNLGGRWSNVYYASNQPGYIAASNSWAMDTKVVDVDVWSKPFSVVAGQVNFGIELSARAEVSDLSQFGLAGGSFSAGADFGHTLRVTGARGFDAGGNAVALGTLVGASGAVYATSPVPEPSAWLLLLAGLAVLPAARRRQHQDI